MAGTILVDEGGGVALNSIGYHRIVESVRAHLDADAQSATQSVFEPNDMEGMTFISLIGASPAVFQSFREAATAAYNEAAKNGQTFAEWDELMRRLGADPRSRAD